MVKQKKNLLILGGVIAGVIVVGLGAFALNSQGGVYKGAIATVDPRTIDTRLVDTKLVDEELKVLTPIEKTDAPAPLPDPPEEEPAFSGEPVADFSDSPKTSAELVSPTLVPKEEEEPVFSGEPVLEGDPETKLESDIPLSLAIIKVPELSSVPVISGYNPTNTPYLPASYGTDAVVLYFDVNVEGNQSDNLYLKEFYVDYNNCVGGYYLKPQDVPKLWSRDGDLIASDADMDGKFAISEFSDFATSEFGTFGIPISVGNGFEFSIKMEVDSTMCPVGSLAQVIVRDILWEDADGRDHLGVPELENDLINSTPDQFTILYDKVMM